MPQSPSQEKGTGYGFNKYINCSKKLMSDLCQENSLNFEKEKKVCVKSCFAHTHTKKKN